MKYNEIPHGKQNWYVQTSGLWQPVTLETVPMRYVEWVHVTPHNSGDVTVEAKLAGTANSEPLQATLFDPYGGTVAQLDLAVDGTTARGQAHVAHPLLWDGDHPNLYSLELKNPSNPTAQLVHTRFGFRELTTADGRLFLNGKPFYMRAALDQDFYPEGIYTPPSADFIRKEMLLSKAMGLNLLRCHIKVPDPRYLEAADETGMLVWYEIPVWNDVYHWTPEAAQRGVDTFHAEVERDWNHPSIVIQSIMNEQWGMDVTQADQRAWLLKSFRDFKQLTAPLGRLITDDSACCKGFHLQSDFADWHTYYSIPDHADALGGLGAGVRRPPQMALQLLWRRNHHRPRAAPGIGVRQLGAPAITASRSAALVVPARLQRTRTYPRSRSLRPPASIWFRPHLSQLQFPR